MITISPLFRVPFVAIAVGLHHYSVNPRNPSSGPSDGTFRRRKDSVSEKTFLSNIRLVTGIVQTIVGGLGIAEIATVIQNPEDGRYSPNALFFVGTGLAISGALIRAWCFQTMGSMFTFDIGINEKQHRLVDTGPYAFVRHPSYSGLYLTFAGLWVWQCAPGSWIRASGALETRTGKAFAVYCAAHSLAAVASFMGRTRAEDRMLEEHFGNEWRAWAIRVPYRLIPYIY